MDNLPFLIGLHGKARSGKSTVTRFLVEEWGYKHYSFATELKEYALHFFNVSRDELEDKTTVSRRILQGIGHMFRNVIDERYWIQIVERKIVHDLDTNNGSRFVISDVRYRNEADWIKNKKGTLWKIVRPTNETLIEYNKDHPSETELDNYSDWDEIVQPNIECVELLCAMVKAIMTKYETNIERG